MEFIIKSGRGLSSPPQCSLRQGESKTPFLEFTGYTENGAHWRWSPWSHSTPNSPFSLTQGAGEAKNQLYGFLPIRAEISIFKPRPIDYNIHHGSQHSILLLLQDQPGSFQPPLPLQWLCPQRSFAECFCFLVQSSCSESQPFSWLMGWAPSFSLPRSHWSDTNWLSNLLCAGYSHIFLVVPRTAF